MSASDPIRDLLASLPRGSIGAPSGTVLITFANVERAGGNIEAVTAWVESRGGSVARTNPIRSRGLRAGRVMAPAPVPGEDVFVVPIEALELDRA